MKIKQDGWYMEDLGRWLADVAGISLENFEAEEFWGDLVAHVAPEDSEDYATISHRKLVHTRVDLAPQTKVMRLGELLRDAPNRQVVERALSAYLRRGDVGPRLCRLAEVEDFHPEGLTAELAWRLRFHTWQALVSMFAQRASSDQQLFKCKALLRFRGKGAELVDCVGICSHVAIIAYKGTD